MIEAPHSTKNREKKRYPEAHSTTKRNNWHFGYKAHIGVDKKTVPVHHLKTTAAHEHNVTVAAELLSGREKLFMEIADIWDRKTSGSNSQEQKRQKNKVQNQSKTIRDSEITRK